MKEEQDGIFDFLELLQNNLARIVIFKRFFSFKAVSIYSKNFPIDSVGSVYNWQKDTIVLLLFRKQKDNSQVKTSLSCHVLLLRLLILFPFRPAQI